MDTEIYEPYMPVNGTEFLQFYDNVCSKCQLPSEKAWRDDGVEPGCLLLVRATACNERPEPWVIKDGQPCCMDYMA